MGLPLDSLARLSNMISAGTLSKPVTPNMLDEHDKENSSKSANSVKYPSATEVQLTQTRVDDAMDLDCEPGSEMVVDHDSHQGSHQSSQSSQSSHQGSATTSSIHTKQPVTITADVGVGGPLPFPVAPTGKTITNPTSAITPPTETLIGPPATSLSVSSKADAAATVSVGNEHVSSLSEMVPATASVEHKIVVRENSASPISEISTTYQHSHETSNRRSTVEELQKVHLSSNVSVVDSTLGPQPHSLLNERRTPGVVDQEDQNQNQDRDSGALLEEPSPKHANTKSSSINISPELEPPKGIFRTRGFSPATAAAASALGVARPVALSDAGLDSSRSPISNSNSNSRQTTSLSSGFKRGNPIPENQSVYGSSSKQTLPTISSYRFPPLPPSSNSGQPAGGSSSSSLMSDQDRYASNVPSPVQSRTTSPTSPTAMQHPLPAAFERAPDESGSISTRDGSAFRSRTHFRPHSVSGTQSQSGIGMERLQESSTSTSGSTSDQLLSALLGAPLSTWKYSDESLVQALQLKAEQERTKQEFYRLETRKKSLKLLSECLRSDIPASSIPFIFQAPDDPAVVAALNAAQGLDAPHLPPQRHDVHAGPSRSSSMKSSVSLPPAQALAPHMTATAPVPVQDKISRSPGTSISMLDRDRDPTASQEGHQRNMSLPVQPMLGSMVTSKKQQPSHQQQQQSQHQQQQQQPPPPPPHQRPKVHTQSVHLQHAPPAPIPQSPTKRSGHQHHASTSALPSYSSPIRGPSGIYGPPRGGPTWQGAQRPAYFLPEGPQAHIQQQQQQPQPIPSQGPLSPLRNPAGLQHPPPQQPQSFSPNSATRLQHIIQFHHWQPITTRPPSSGVTASSSGQSTDSSQLSSKRRKSTAGDAEESSPPSVATAAAIASTTGAQVASGTGMSTAAASAMAHSRRRTMGHARHRSEAAISLGSNWGGMSPSRRSPRGFNENTNESVPKSGSSMLDTLAATASAESAAAAEKQQGGEHVESKKEQEGSVEEDPNESKDKAEKHDVKFMMSN